ncbi:metal ABC transporter permease [Pelagibacterium montanilacus]|uniref:metal ABC transporter permease n=1 Tax=Pelagibacterium montanilacus TaxID=2185280 RepID=UPI000F8E63FC|nr:metal ABC transporter permease [Pelagibacterium montanilacus]
MLALLADSTIQNVLVGAALLGAISGVLGSFAVLRRQSLLGDTLSHAALPGICIGFLLAGARDMPAILAGALAAGALAALAIIGITRHTRLKTDAALGIVLSVFFALGVVLLTFIQSTGTGTQAGLETFLFGQAAAILRADLYLMGAITLGALVLVALLWKEFKLVTFDPVFARTSGFPVLALEIALTMMIALAVVVGLQMVGVILMAAMIVAPAVAARQWTDRLSVMVVLAAGFGILAGTSGAIVSATARGLSTGPLIVLAISAIVLVSLLLAPRNGLIPAWLRQRAGRRELHETLVLGTLSHLAVEHGDPDYRAEQAMIDAYHGTRTHQALEALAQKGLVAPARHAPETTPHWRLTDKGHARVAHPTEREDEPQ